MKDTEIAKRAPGNFVDPQFTPDNSSIYNPEITGDVYPFDHPVQW